MMSKALTYSEAMEINVETWGKGNDPIPMPKHLYPALERIWLFEMKGPASRH
jgi:hypothetical protein